MSLKKLKLDLELFLPEDAAACDACTARMLATLQGRQGLSEVHVDSQDPAHPKLCLHYEPELIRLERVRALVEEAGARLQNRYAHLSVAVTGLRHERQAQLISGLLLQQPGVLHASAGLGSAQVYIEFDPAVTTREALLNVMGQAGLGIRAESPPRTQPQTTQDRPKKVAGEAEPEVHAEHTDHQGHADEGHEGHAHGGIFGERTELIFSLACGAMTGLGWLLSKTAVPAWLPIACFVIAYVLGAWFTIQEVFIALRARRFEIDFLMLLAAIGAAVLGEWFEGALLLFLFTLGHSLESYAMGRARQAIEALGKLVPETALRLDAGGEIEVPVSALALGDRVRVRPNTRIPADGYVIDGTSSVNQAPITGESLPVDKRPVPDPEAAAARPAGLEAEYRVFAGTINGPGALTIAVSKVAAESTLARVVKMVAEAETQKSATQQFTDRFERIFVPAILVLIGLLLFAWVVIDEPFARSFYRAMAVLVAASPCALAIATPSAVLSGVARAAREGVLIKGGAHLESLGAIQVVAFDKTGTLTEGKPSLTDVVVLDGDESELLRVALAVEKQSDHPLASAIVTGAASRLPPNGEELEASAAEAIIGFGIRARVQNAEVLIGKPGLFTKERALPEGVAAAVETLQTQGRTVMIVQADERFLGVLGVMDTPRASAREVVAQLHRLGIEKTLMLSGDNQRVADAVAAQVGLKEARGDLLPEQKVAVIAELARSASKVAMVGDGVNDAPAMANATVGIAMGAGGSDVALETADVALMADDLRALPFAVGLSRAARGIIRQNLWASLGMVAFLIPATIFGFAGIGVAVVLHEGSTLLVVANALRLLAYKNQPPAT